MTFTLFLDRGSEAVEARFPQPAVLREPFVDFAERLRPENVEAPLPIRPYRDEAGSLQDAQMARDARLVNPGLRDDVVDLPLAVTQRIHDATAGRVGKGLEGVYMHYHVYARYCIYIIAVKP